MSKPKMKLNPDKETVDFVREGLKARDGYCPCVVAKNEDTKCPCKKFREERECCCNLYVRDEEQKDEGNQ